MDCRIRIKNKNRDLPEKSLTMPGDLAITFSTAVISQSGVFRAQEKKGGLS